MEGFGENGYPRDPGCGADIGERENRGMKIMLRDLETGLLYRQPGEWVESQMHATGFAEPEEAEAEGRAMGKSNLEVFCTWPDGKTAWGWRIEG